MTLHKSTRFLLVTITVFYLFFAYFFRKESSLCLVSNGDSVGYYSYLPAFFIHNDLRDLRKTTLERVNETNEIGEKQAIETLEDRQFTGFAHDGGRRLIQYTYGIAFLQTSGFLLAHAISPFLGFEATGYTLPYRVLVFLNGLFFTLLGLWILARILKSERFDDKTINFTLFSVALATNLFYFSTANAYMSHAYLFTLWTLVVRFTQKFYTEGLEHKQLWRIGFLLGLITIIRPVDIVVIFVPLLYGVKNIADFKVRCALIWQKKIPVLGAIFLATLAILPQLFYWHHLTGHWFFDSYKGQGFDFKNSQVWEGWFGFANGWLVYTPIMFLALLGIFIMGRKSPFLLPILLILPLYAYVIHSWWCWNYINGFGMRPMVDMYGLLAIPLSVFFQKTLQNIFSKSFFSILVFFLSGLNIFQTWQYSQNVIFPENGNYAFWISSFGKTKLDYNALVAFDSNELQPSKAPKTMVLLEKSDFEDSTDVNFTRKIVKDGNFAYDIPPNGHSQRFEVSGKNLLAFEYVKVTLSAYATNNNFYDIWQKCNLVVQFKKGDENIKWRAMRLENKIGQDSKILAGQTKVWGDIHFYVKIPPNLNETDKLNVEILNGNTAHIVVDNLKIEVCKD
jgi:hypothetical protein